jgi:hypothetical protein
MRDRILIFKYHSDELEASESKWDLRFQIGAAAKSRNIHL